MKFRDASRHKYSVTIGPAAFYFRYTATVYSLASFGKKKTISESARTVALEVIAIWDEFSIPSQENKNISRRIKKLYEEYFLLKKRKSKISVAAVFSREEFVKKLNSLFDISINEIKSDSRIMNILEQQNKRIVGNKFLRSMKIEKSQSPQPSTSSMQNKSDVSCLDISKLSLSVSLSSTSENVSTSSSEYNPPIEKKVKLLSSSTSTKKVKVITTDLAAALDRSKLSNASATLLIASTAQALGHNIESITVSKETLRRSREKRREEIFTEIRKSFNSEHNLIVHWDGKILEDLPSQATVDRICVAVSGKGMTKLLGVPKIEKGTGALQAEVIYLSLEEWMIIDRVKGMCFDTTSTNTGMAQGACTLLEKKIGRPLLWLACRHHVLELIVAAVYTKLMKEVSSGPDILLFKKFKKSWSTIDSAQIQSGMDDAVVQQIFSASEKLCTIDFINSQLEIMNKERADYREMLYLALLFLGEPIQVAIRKPGAISRARWMARIIYGLKIYLFRGQFKLTGKIILS